MANEAVTEPVAPAASLSEHRQRKAAAAAGSAAPPAEKQAPAVPQGETAGESATPKQETQEKPKPRAKNAEERAAELRAAGRTKEADEILAKDAESKEFEQWKASKADREREAEELRQYRTRQTQAVPAAPPAPELPKAAPVTAEPDLDEYMKAPENKDLTFGQVQKKFLKDHRSWERAEEQKQAQAETTNRTVAEKEDAARKVHADYDQVMKGQNFVNTIYTLHQNAVVAAALELPHGTEVLYRLAKDPTECRRIAGLSQWSQVIELGAMSKAIAAESQQQTPPEKPKQPVPISRTPPPPRNIAGVAAPEKQKPEVPTKFSEHQANRGRTRAS